MKNTLRVLCLLLALSICFCALAEPPVAFEPTIDKNISFNDIPWNITEGEFKRHLEELCSDFKSTYTDYGDISSSYSSSSASYGDGKIIPRFFSKTVRTREYDFDSKSLSSSTMCKVAGHSAGFINAKFYYTLPSSLYEIKITILEDKLLTEKEQYEDLQKKLTVLYGNPYEYSEEYGKDFTDCSVWLSSNGTAVYLKYNYYYSMCFESVILCYGLRTSYDTLKEMEDQSTAEQEKKKEDALGDIADDYSGL